MKKFVVYPGSFNPVTKGHFSAMESAIKSVNADIGLFFITSRKELESKMIKKKNYSFILSDEERKKMIESLNIENQKIYYGGVEEDDIHISTAKIIKRLQLKHPKDEIYLLIGADELREIPKWDKIDTIIDSIKIIVAMRNGYDMEKIIKKNDWLLRHRDSLILIALSQEALSIRSSEVRTKFLLGEEYKNLMNEGPYKILSKFNTTDLPGFSQEKFLQLKIIDNGNLGYKYASIYLYNFNKDIFKQWNEDLLGNKGKMLKNTKVYDKEFKTSFNFKYNTIFQCENIDCSDAAEVLINEGYNVAILNLASNVSPGGGYHIGASAQEESICHVSTLSQSLYQFGDLKYKHIREANLPNFPGVYPMDINYGGIYSPDITFFRYSRNKNYSLREKPFSCAIISVASLSNAEENEYVEDENKLFNEDGTFTLKGKNIEMNKIRTIYRIALDNKIDALVLGAFGCGEYYLLPEEVSKLFYITLNEHEFKGNFKKIVFAILEDPKRKSIGKDGKFKPFYDIFS